MEGIFFRVFFVLSILFTSQAYGQEAVDCVSHNDLKKIAASFSQFDKYVKNKTQYCEADMDVEWLKIANSLVVLMNTVPDEPAVDNDDALTFKAISEKDWWSYFTKRANKFNLDKNCPQNVVAYVMPFWGNGTINLCNLFFDISVSSQASTMMHEVRHFDGHSHVTCTQGNEKGISGACDGQITGKGSYAISVQTLVGMARSKDTKKEEKALLEAEAVYMAFNKFNTVPKVKLNNSIILSNNVGEVYRWTIGQGVKLVKQLTEASVVLNSSNNMTIYPIDTESDAYRVDRTFEVAVENPGLYAKQYNSETPQDRELYKSISYFGTGGMLKGNDLYTLCNQSTVALGKTNLDSKGQFNAIISMSLDEKDQSRESLLLADNGDLYRFECRDNSSDVVNFQKSDVKMAGGAMGIVDSFGFDGEQYALLDDGSLTIVSIANSVMNLESLNLPVVNKDWISATPYSQPEVF